MTIGSEKVADLTILHQIGLGRFSTGVVKRIRSTLRRMQADIEAQIRERLPTDENGFRDAQSLRLGALLRQVRITQEEAHRAIRFDFDREVQEACAAEADFQLGLTRAQVGVEARLATVSAQQIEAAVMTQPLQGKTLREWTDQLQTGDVSRVQGQITMGYLEGESVPQVVRRVQQVATVTDRGAETLVRTSMTHINARAVERNAKANPDLFARYQWVSVLDNRTTPVCRSRAGKSFEHGNGPLPPAHPNCRSTVFSLVKGVGPAEDLGYEDWLRRQDAETQRDILGATRYKLWKAGDVKLDRFVDGGRTLTLEQLRARDAEAFERAGIGKVAASPPPKPKAAPSAKPKSTTAQRAPAAPVPPPPKPPLPAPIVPPVRPVAPPVVTPPREPVETFNTGRRTVDTSPRPEGMVAYKRQLANDERLALQNYKFDDFEGVNQLLTRGKVVSESGLELDELGTSLVKRRISRMDSAFETARLKEDAVLYRGMSSKVLAGQEIGTEFTVPAFQSATTSRQVATRFAVDGYGKTDPVLLRIRAPKGARAIDMDRLVDANHTLRQEREILLDRGANLRVVGKETVFGRDQLGALRQMEVIDVEYVR